MQKCSTLGRIARSYACDDDAEIGALMCAVSIAIKKTHNF
jgi:hypothetical protein